MRPSRRRGIDIVFQTRSVAEFAPLEAITEGISTNIFNIKYGARYSTVQSPAACSKRWRLDPFSWCGRRFQRHARLLTVYGATKGCRPQFRDAPGLWSEGPATHPIKRCLVTGQNRKPASASGSKRTCDCKVNCVHNPMGRRAENPRNRPRRRGFWLGWTPVPSRGSELFRCGGRASV